MLSRWFEMRMLNFLVAQIDEQIMAAEPMNKDEIIRRREEGYFQHLLATEQLLRLALARADRRVRRNEFAECGAREARRESRLLGE